MASPAFNRSESAVADIGDPGGPVRRRGRIGRVVAREPMDNSPALESRECNPTSAAPRRAGAPSPHTAACCPSDTGGLAATVA